MEFTSVVSDFYENKSVLITGGTGCIGKILVEKLLRTCLGINKIFLLIRPKKGKSPKERLEMYCEMPIFEMVKGVAQKNLVLIEGDISLPNLGISNDDCEMLIQEVSIVFHCAATIRFDEPLHDAININLVGTGSLLTFCKRFKKLESFVHTSTAYSNCYRTHIAEDFYSTILPPQKLILLARELGPKALNAKTKELIYPHPNTYTFTKNMAETLVKDEGGTLPIAIVRPCIVTCVWKEPIPGFTPNLSGVNGIITMGSTGVLRTMRGNGELLFDCIPVDVAINWLIAVGWYTATFKPGLKIYNCVGSPEDRQNWNTMIETALQLIRKYPHHRVLRYPGGSLKSSWLWNKCHVIFNHYLIALIVDFLYVVLAQKPYLIKTYRKIHETTNSFMFFTVRQWMFQSDNIKEIIQRMNALDQRTYYLETKTLHWEPYWKQNVICNRRLIFGEEIDTLPSARRALSRKYWIGTFLKEALLALFIYFLIGALSEEKGDVSLAI